MVSLLAVYQEVLHAATVMLIREIIARAPTMGRNEPTVVYGIASLPVVFQEVLLAETVLILEVIARVLTMEVNGRTVVYGIDSLLVVCQEARHAARHISEIIAQAPIIRRMM